MKTEREKFEPKGAFKNNGNFGSKHLSGESLVTLLGQ